MPNSLDQKREQPIPLFSYELTGLPAKGRILSVISLPDDWIAISICCKEPEEGVFYVKLNLNTGESACQKVLTSFETGSDIHLCKLPENKVLLISSMCWAIIDASNQIINRGETPLQVPRINNFYAAKISLQDCANRKYFFYDTDTSKYLLVVDIQQDEIVFSTVSYAIAPAEILSDILFVGPDGIALCRYFKGEKYIKLSFCSITCDQKVCDVQKLNDVYVQKFKDGFYVSSAGDFLICVSRNSLALELNFLDTDYFFKRNNLIILYESTFSNSVVFVQSLRDNRFILFDQNNYWLYDCNLGNPQQLITFLPPENAELALSQITPEGEMIRVYTTHNGQHQVLVDRVALLSEHPYLQAINDSAVFPTEIVKLITNYLGFFKSLPTAKASPCLPLSARRTLAPPCLSGDLRKKMCELYYQSSDKERKLLKDLSDVLWENRQLVEKHKALFKSYVDRVLMLNPNVVVKGIFGSKINDFLAEVEKLGLPQTSIRCRIM